MSTSLINQQHNTEVLLINITWSLLFKSQLNLLQTVVHCLISSYSDWGLWPHDLFLPDLTCSSPSWSSAPPTCCPLISLLLSWPFLQGRLLLFSSPSPTLSWSFYRRNLLFHLYFSHKTLTRTYLLFFFLCIFWSVLYSLSPLKPSHAISEIFFCPSCFPVCPFLLCVALFLSCSLLWPLRPPGSVLWPQPRWYQLPLQLLPALPSRPPPLPPLLPLLLVPHSAQWDNPPYFPIFQSLSYIFFPELTWQGMPWNRVVSHWLSWRYTEGCCGEIGWG